MLHALNYPFPIYHVNTRSYIPSHMPTVSNTFRTVIFQDDEEVIAPLWRRVVASLPEGLIRGSSSSSSASNGSGSSSGEQ